MSEEQSNSEDEKLRQRDEQLSRRAKSFKSEHFGVRYAKASFGVSGSVWEPEKVAQLLNWIKHGKNMLVMIGPPGTGKTWACAALAELVFKKYDTVRYWKEQKILSKLRDGIDQGMDYGKLLEYLLDDQFVYYDDLGSNPPNDWRKEVIFNILDYRYNSRLPTVVTSNLNKREISEKYEPRVASRLFAAENTIITLWGKEDLRELGQ